MNYFLRNVKRLAQTSSGYVWEGGRIAAIEFDRLTREGERQGLTFEQVRDGKAAVTLSDGLRVRYICFACGSNRGAFISHAVVMRDGLRARYAAWRRRTGKYLVDKLSHVELRLYYSSEKLKDCVDIPKYSLTNICLGPIYNVI
jgi:hypothetical protein